MLRRPSSARWAPSNTGLELESTPSIFLMGGMRSQEGTMRDISRTVCAIVVLASLALTTKPGAEETSGLASGTQATLQNADPAPTVTILGSKQAQGVLGKEVRSTADENMGRIVDVIVDREGQVRAAIIDFGGFLGVGSRKIAVDWNALRFPAEGSGKPITVELTRENVKGAPEYKAKSAVIVLGAKGGLRPLPDE
jgi:hypothetical protein